MNENHERGELKDKRMKENTSLSYKGTLAEVNEVRPSCIATPSLLDQEHTCQQKLISKLLENGALKDYKAEALC